MDVNRPTVEIATTDYADLISDQTKLFLIYGLIQNHLEYDQSGIQLDYQFSRRLLELYKILCTSNYNCKKKQLQEEYEQKSKE